MKKMSKVLKKKETKNEEGIYDKRNKINNLTGKESILVLFKGRTWKEEVNESKKKWNFDLNVVKNDIQIDSTGGVTLVIRNLKK